MCEGHTCIAANNAWLDHALVHPLSFAVPLITGNKGRKSPSSREEFGDDVIDDAMSTTSIDTYGSALDYSEAYNGGGGGAWEAAGGEEGVNSKAVDDFKDGVEQLMEKRWDYSSAAVHLH